MFKTGMRVGEELGAVWHLPLYQAGLAELHCHVGRWDEALVEAETALTIGEEVGTRIAMVVYEALGARRDSARVLATMRSFGMRRGSRAAHRRALKGWDSLTPTESDVVRLTVAGLTNREIGERLFISRRTVQTHLSHVFTKLEISTRVELAAAAATDRRA